MNVLFLSLLDFESFEERNIYSDLLREFMKNGHRVCCVSPVEKRKGKKTTLLNFSQNSILKLKIGNTQKVNLIEKGISTLRIEPLFIRGIKRFYSDVKFDLVLYTTPPVTFAKVIRFVKKRDRAKSYLMLKDIFPQNSVDLGMLSKRGLKGWIYKFFRKKEVSLYKLSDKIGCMSEANATYLIQHNSDIDPKKVEICPNCVEPVDMRATEEEKKNLRAKYGLPLDKKIFVYGGNLGRPQDVPFVVACLKACAEICDAYFVIAGSGTDRHYIAEYVENEVVKHAKLFGQMPKNEYDKMVSCCDVGLVFLDHRFTIPNFPSRLLAYMQAGLPVLACTDRNTDVGQVITNGGFGWWCESNSARAFSELVISALATNLDDYGEKGYKFLEDNYTVKKLYGIIAGKQ